MMKHGDQGLATQMRHAILLGAVALLGIASSQQASAQLYKWVGADGKVNYSDTPPPANAKQVTTQANTAGAQASVALPYELAAAVAKNPVTLYTFADCTPCNEGRALLKKRGVPFKEKTIKTREDSEKLKQVSGQEQLPLLLISSSKFTGYNEQQWNEALSQAGYPETSRLPANFSYSAPEPAAPVLATPTNADNTEAKKTSPASKAPAKPAQTQPGNEAGIRF